VKWIERLETRATTSARPLYVDSGLALVFVVVTLVSVNNQDITGQIHEAQFRDSITALLVAAPIAFRRTAPLTALAVSCAAIFVHIVSHAPDGATPLAVAVLIYSVAAWTPIHRAVAGLGILTLTMIGLGVFSDGEVEPIDVAFTLAMFAILWAGGVAMRARRESSDLRVHQATELARTEAERAARAVAEERLRIAQDLHDVVAHSISVIAVQAGVGSHFLDTNPEKTRAALDAIGATSRGTLNELRRLLGVLRDDSGDANHLPAPTLAQLPHLVDDVARLGMPVELKVTGEPDIEHRAIEMSAYRVVQEALTNVLKHAGPTTHVEVEVDHLPDQLQVRVVDDGRGASVVANGVKQPSGHHGLIGMRERVDVWGGSLVTGPKAGGGFSVVATFPYGTDS
jgi:signal transduction histidine kinase